jgi:uncharacterized protein YdhG (YjbR/CyaY superfamily)
MDNSRPTPKNIDEYIAGYSADIQQILQKIRALIHETAPEAQETISYQVPTFTLKGNLVHFAAFKSHISFFPASSGVEKFKNELEGYKTSKGTIQFPLGQPIPYDLIRRIVLFRVQENLTRAEAKAKKKK